MKEDKSLKRVKQGEETSKTLYLVWLNMPGLSMYCIVLVGKSVEDWFRLRCKWITCKQVGLRFENNKQNELHWRLHLDLRINEVNSIMYSNKQIILNV